MGLKDRGLGGNGFLGGPLESFCLSSKLGLSDLGLDEPELEWEDCVDVLLTGGGGRALFGGPFLLRTGDEFEVFDGLSFTGAGGRGLSGSNEVAPNLGPEPMILGGGGTFLIGGPFPGIGDLDLEIGSTGGSRLGGPGLDLPLNSVETVREGGCKISGDATGREGGGGAGTDGGLTDGGIGLGILGGVETLKDGGLGTLGGVVTRDATLEAGGCMNP